MGKVFGREDCEKQRRRELAYYFRVRFAATGYMFLEDCVRCYRSVVYPSVCMWPVTSCTLLKPLDGMRCHLARTLVPT